MDFNELDNYLRGLPDRVLDDASRIVAETATEYYKERFREKEFDGSPWQPAKVPKRRGSLLVDSGSLLNSIRPVHVWRDGVIISAGNLKVDYAKAHNEGFVGNVTVPAHTRRTKRGGNVSVRQHSKSVDMPRRQFMGESRELADRLHDRIQGYIDNDLK